MKLRLQREAHDGSAGMTLIEVIVAISIMGIIATGAVSLSITSEKSAATQQRQELAVTIANQAMEFVASQPAGTNPTIGMSYLFGGRAADAVSDSWAANAGTDGLDLTYPVSDTTATAASVAVIPLSATVTQSGTEYTTHTLIGTCFQPISGSGDCTTLTGVATPPSVAPGATPLLRVMVVVRWNAGSGCSASGCSYQATSLIDAHDDLLWKTVG